MFVKITFFSIFFPHEVVVAAKKKTLQCLLRLYLVYVNICKLVSACTFKYEK